MVSCRMSHSKQSMETQYGSKLQARGEGTIRDQGTSDFGDFCIDNLRNKNQRVEFQGTLGFLLTERVFFQPSPEVLIAVGS